MLAAADFTPTATALLVAAGGAAAVFAVVFAVRFAASFPALSSPGPETADLGDESPAVANLLVNRCQVTHAAAAATLLDLAARGYLEVFEAGVDHYVVRLRTTAAAAPLTPYEEQVMDLVRSRATGGSAPLEAVQLGDAEAAGWHTRFSKAVVRDARSRGLLRGRWSRLDWALFAALARVAWLLLASGLDVSHVEQTARATTTSGLQSRNFQPQDWYWVAVGGWALTLAVIARFRSIRFAPAGSQAAARWLGVKHYLAHDRSFGDAPPAAVTIWKQLLAYGTALGVARAAAAAIPLSVEDRHTAWSRAGGDWHPIHVEYPRHFGYGESPRSVFLGGLLRVLFWGALCFVILPVAVNSAWSVGSDALNRHQVASGAVVGLVVGFVLVFGGIAAVLLARFGDGVVRAWRGGADFGRSTMVEGPVVKVVGTGDWFAVDPGHVDHVQAWHAGAARLPARGATVRVQLTPHLCHVTAVDVLTSPDAPTPRAPSWSSDARAPSTPPEPSIPPTPAPVQWSAPPADGPARP
ncbi:MAG TPA: hypothetical protein VI462_17270 [Acidimicrobiia bacterium]